MPKHSPRHVSAVGCQAGQQMRAEPWNACLACAPLLALGLAMNLLFGALTLACRVTRADAAADFFGERNVPRQAITMGVATILKARLRFGVMTLSARNESLLMSRNCPFVSWLKSVAIQQNLQHKPVCSVLSCHTQPLPHGALQMRRVILIAFGENKAGVAAQAVEGPVTPGVAASYLQEHPDATVYLDHAAAAGELLGAGHLDDLGL